MIVENNKGLTVLQLGSENQSTLMKNAQHRDSWFDEELHKQHPNDLLDNNVNIHQTFDLN